MAKFPNVSKEARQSPGGRTSKGDMWSPAAMAFLAPVVNPEINPVPILPQVQQLALVHQELNSSTKVIAPDSMSETVLIAPAAHDPEVHPITQTAPESIQHPEKKVLAMLNHKSYIRYSNFSLWSQENPFQ